MDADHGGYHSNAADHENPNYSVCDRSEFMIEARSPRIVVLTLSPAIDLQSQCWLYGQNQHQEVCCYIDARHGVVRSLEIIALRTWERGQPCVGWIWTLESLVM